MKIEIQSKDYARMRRALGAKVSNHVTDTALWDACMANDELMGFAVAYGWEDARTVERLLAQLKEHGTA